MKKLILALVFTLFSFNLQATDFKLPITPVEQTEFNKLPPVLSWHAQYYLTVGYASQKIVSQCKRVNVAVPNFVMQGAESEEPVKFDLLFVQNKILVGLNGDAAEAINKSAFTDSDRFYFTVEKSLNLDKERREPVSWCKTVAPKIVHRMLIYYNENTRNVDISSFKEFVIAKNQYLEAMQALDALGSSY